MGRGWYLLPARPREREGRIWMRQPAVREGRTALQFQGLDFNANAALGTVMGLFPG